MSLLRWHHFVAGCVAVVPAAASAQQWDSPAALALVERAVARREGAERLDGPRRWDATARGMVFFLTQFGGDRVAPRLVKADELLVEVYWEAPGRSKQTIRAWRDEIHLPTDIHYHRDHLGIVTNDFGPLIRIGDGDEVRDVPHPLSREGWTGYQFALTDSVTIASAGQSWQVQTVQVRPRDPAGPAVIGTLYLERRSAALVRFRFSFTPAAYRERIIEDITVVLENALHDGGSWLPWRQEIEIRRRPPIIDLPVRGIIRGRWELDGFRLDEEAPPGVFTGPAIGGLVEPGGPDGLWPEPLADRVAQLLGEVSRLELDELRDQFRAIVGKTLPGTGPPARMAFGSLSDLVRVNRVEGIRLGLGGRFRLPGTAVSTTLWAGYAVARNRLSGRAEVQRPVGSGADVSLTGESVVIEAGHAPVISPMLNSLLTQEAGRDYGDWVERRSVGVAWRRWGTGGVFFQAGLAAEEYRPVAVSGSAARGSFRPNPAFPRSEHLVIGARIGRRPAPLPGETTEWDLAVEAGAGPSPYGRVLMAGGWRGAAGPGELRLSGSAGWASAGSPAVRGFAIGGWGTLPGTPFRAYGGRAFGLGRVEWLVPLTLPPLPLGSVAGPRPELRVGPFVAAGLAGGPIGGTPWQPSGGIRPVAGVAMEGLFGLIRAEVGFGLRGGGTGASADIVSSWWIML